MISHPERAWTTLALLLLPALASETVALDIVKNGKPAATIVVADAGGPATFNAEGYNKRDNYRTPRRGEPPLFQHSSRIC